MSMACRVLSMGLNVLGSPSKTKRCVHLTDLRASFTSVGQRQPLSSTMAITKPVGGVPRCLGVSGSAVLIHRQSASAGGAQPSKRCRATSFQRQASAMKSPFWNGVGPGAPRSGASRWSRTCRIFCCLHSSSSWVESPTMPLTSTMRSPLPTWRRGLARFQSLKSPPSTASMSRVLPSLGLTCAPRLEPPVLSSVMQYSFLEAALPCKADQLLRTPGLMMGTMDLASPFVPSLQSRV
mmetsp:Transcript_26619/g.82897  ORF Transcript_26619/g.82897 Transcript_26619/m.82897 type:complete len:237 (+) Transcript_26619:1485-2195(+)